MSYTTGTSKPLGDYFFYSWLQSGTPRLWKLSGGRSNTAKWLKHQQLSAHEPYKHGQDISRTSIIIGAICRIRRIIRVFSSRNRICYLIPSHFMALIVGSCVCACEKSSKKLFMLCHVLHILHIVFIIIINILNDSWYGRQFN